MTKYMYTLINPVTGQRWPLLKNNLTRNLMPNCIFLQDGEHLGVVTHRDLVVFVRRCVSEVLVAQLVDEPDQSLIHVLGLVDRWLEDEKSVTPEELKAASKTAETSACTTDQPSLTIWIAMQLSRAAADIAWADWCAARSSEYAYRAGFSYETQAQWLVEHLQQSENS